MALQLRRKVHESVVFIDRDSAPRLVASGTASRPEALPGGARVRHADGRLRRRRNREAALRYALSQPHDCGPLYAQLQPGMKVTMAIDGLSMPLPPMRTPDV